MPLDPVMALVAAASASDVGILGELSRAAEGVRPWLSTGALLGLLALCGRLYLTNKKMEVDTEGGIRDHYAKELASLRAQILETQKLADARLANAEKRYNEAMQNADTRHRGCEQECDRLREKVQGLERQIEQIHRASLKLFALRDDLSEETRETLRSLEQAAFIDAPTPRRRGWRR